MFDDLFCTSVLVSVGAVLAAGVWIGASEFSGPTPTRPAATVALQPASVKALASERTASGAAMPIYDLPRVVVSGNRSREGDMLAGGLRARDGLAAGR